MKSSLHDLFNAFGMNFRGLAQYVTDTYDHETARAVVGIFKGLQLPLPEKGDEYITTTRGVLLGIEPYGIILRIEDKDRYGLDTIAPRMDDPLTIQPLRTFDAGLALVEIVPGVHTVSDNKYDDLLRQALWGHDIDFWDAKPSNIGLLPVRTPDFPEGIPVVIDRLSMKRLPPDPSEPRRDPEGALGNMALYQEELYGGLKRLLERAWPEGGSPDAAAIQNFWQAAARMKDEGKLVSGWTEKSTYNDKIDKVRSAGKAYARKLPGPK